MNRALAQIAELGTPEGQLNIVAGTGLQPLRRMPEAGNELQPA